LPIVDGYVLNPLAIVNWLWLLVVGYWLFGILGFDLQGF
jgi:hypothetical protein